MKRGPTQTQQLNGLLEGISKAALFDLVVDLVRRSEGDESLDGEALAKAIAVEFEPVRAIRRDPRLHHAGRVLEVE